MNNTSLKIEELLKQVGDTDVPDDVMHRYRLRRSLLCSSYFDSTCERNEKKNRFIAYTAPLFAGTVLVVVFAVTGTSILDGSAVSDPKPTIDTSRFVSADHLSAITFVPAKTASYATAAEFIDTSYPPIPLSDSLRFVPMSPTVVYSVQ